MPEHQKKAIEMGILEGLIDRQTNRQTEGSDYPIGSEEEAKAFGALAVGFTEYEKDETLRAEYIEYYAYAYRITFTINTQD